LDQTMLTAEISSRKRVVSANRQFLTKADYHFDEIENKPFFPMFIDSDRTADDIFDSVMKGETIRVTQKMVSKYKTEFWILGQYTPVKDAGGKISKILFLGNDISRRIDIENKNAKLLEETLEKAELLSQQEKEMRRNFLELMDTQKEIKDKEFEVNTLLTAIDINLVKSEFDEKGNLLNANKKFIETFKYSKAEISNLTIENIVDKQTSPEFDALWLNLFSKDEAFQFEVETKNNEDETIWLMTSFTPLKNEEGQIIKIVFLANEITEHKKAQFKIHTQSQNLLHQEELMKLNMEEMLDEQEKLSAKLQEYLHVEESLGTEFETDSDKIYNKWVQTL